MARRSARTETTFAEFLASPIIATRKRDEALTDIFRNRVTDLTLRFLLVLNHKGRLGHLQHINAAYEELLQEAQGRIEIDVYTASPMDERQLEHIRGEIREAFKKDPVLIANVDASMLGGLKLRIGDQLIDGSIASRLRRLKESFMTSGASNVRDRFEKIIEEEGGGP